MTYARRLAGLLVSLIAGSAGLAAHAGPFAYIANSNGNNVSVIDIATNALVATVPVGTFPYGVGVSPAGTRAYVANGNGNNVSVIDTASNGVVATVTVGSGPFGVAVNPAGTRVYVVNRGNQFETPTVSVIDAATDTVVGSIGSLGGTPQGIAIAGSRAYVTNSAGVSNSVSVIDLATDTVVGTVAVGTLPLGVAVNPAGTRVYVTNNGSSNVSVIDTATNAVIATLPVGGMPYGVAVTPDGTRAYVATFAGNDVEVINTATNTFVAYIGAGNRPIAFGLFIGGPSGPPPTAPAIAAIRPNSASVAGGSAVVIEGANLAAVTGVTFGGSPASILSLSAGALMVAAPSHAAGAVDVVVSSPAGVATAAGGFLYVNNDSAARDFSIAANPSARWSYGWEAAGATPGGAFTLYPNSYPGVSPQWSTGGLPNVLYNTAATPLNVATNTTPPGGLALHPGAALEYSVARWTAPASGVYHVAGFYAGLDFAGITTTDVWVLHNNNAAAPLFNGAIASYNVPLNFSFDVTVAFGDTIEFAVGPGASYSYDATQLDATITPIAVSPLPAIMLTPPSLTFAPRTVGTASTAQSVTVAASGANVTIASITINGDFAFTSDCAAVLATGATCTIDVTFTPLSAGTRAGSVDIASDASANPHAVPLSGIGQNAPVPVIETTPATLDFAPQALGAESAVQTVSVANTGSATLFFGPIAITGDFVRRPLPPRAPGAAPRPPTFDGECSVGLAPGTTCDIAVVFVTSTEGRRAGSLTIASNATLQPATVLLLGTGIVSTPPRLLSVAESVRFEAQPVGTSSAGRAVTITNNSSSRVVIAELDVTGDFNVSDTCTSVPAPGTCSLLVTFRPSAEGERTGALTLRALSEAQPYEVILAGAGVFNPVPALEVSVARAGFGNALIGTTPMLEGNLVNIGEVPVALGPITATGDFLVSHSCGAALAVGASCPVQVRFFPRMLGPQVGSLEVISNAAGSPHQVQFSGTGCSIPSVGRSRLRPVLCAP